MKVNAGRLQPLVDLRDEIQYKIIQNNVGLTFLARAWSHFSVGDGGRDNQLPQIPSAHPESFQQ